MFVDGNSDGDADADADDDNVWTTATPTTFGARQSPADSAAHARSPCHTHVVLLFATHTHTHTHTSTCTLYISMFAKSRESARPETRKHVPYHTETHRSGGAANICMRIWRACRHICERVYVCVSRCWKSSAPCSADERELLATAGHQWWDGWGQCCGVGAMVALCNRCCDEMSFSSTSNKTPPGQSADGRRRRPVARWPKSVSVAAVAYILWVAGSMPGPGVRRHNTHTHPQTNKNCDAKYKRPHSLNTTRPYVANLNTSACVISVERDSHLQV